MLSSDLILRLPYMLFDFRGRVDRKGLLLLAGAMLAVQLVFGLVILAGWIDHQGPLGIAINGMLIWTALVAAAKRLHDLGRTAWWIAASLLFIVVWSVATALVLIPVYGETLLEPASPGYWTVLVVNIVPALAATLWMHFAKGDTGANRYGPAPDHTGFSAPKVSDRSAPDGALAA